MAIIKCPECGHQISDKAPVCPNCGVEIAGKLTLCPNCGEIYFKNLDRCPNCHCPNNLVSPTPPVPPTPPAPTQTTEANGTEQPQHKKSNMKIPIISFVIALVICGLVYYFYSQANQDKEQEAYEYAMQSSDPEVLQSYLDNYKDADQAHIDSIMSHLNALKLVDNDWTNAVVSGSKEALEAYLQKYPDSPHKQEAWNKIDSIDWNFAKTADTAEAYQNYLNAHADGAHIEEAENALKKVKSKDLQPEEQQMISGIFKQFFQSINTRNEDGLTATCEDVLSSLLGKYSATKADVVTFMHKLYKSDVSSMVWRINNDYQIRKREIGDEEYEYQVTFSAHQNVSLNDGSTKDDNFKISGTVSPDGKISSFNMARINAN